MPGIGLFERKYQKHETILTLRPNFSSDVSVFERKDCQKCLCMKFHCMEFLFFIQLKTKAKNFLLFLVYKKCTVYKLSMISLVPKLV